MKIKLLFLLLFTALLSFAQNPTDVDHNFGPEPGFSGPVKKILVQQDGKIIVQSAAQFYKQTQIKTLIRINIDGSLDPTFNYNPATIFKINSIALQPDGKIIVGGYDGILIRINTDGSRDTSFNSTPNFEKDSYINCITVQPDGKILVTNKSDSPRVPLKYLTRLNSDGSIDSTFNIGTGFFNKPINSLAVQSNGKILVVCEFSFFQVNAQKNLIRLNADGTKDTSFDIGTGFDGYIYSIILQNDGKIIVGGSFSSYQGIAQLYLIRLNTDGSKDTSFINPSNFKNFNDINIYDVSDICLQTDGKIIVNFHTSNTNSATADDFIYRFNSDGSFDTSFSKVNFNRGKHPLTPYYFDADVHTIALLNNGKIIIGGVFSFCRNVIENNIVCLNADGSKDSSFYKETGFDNSVSSTAIQTDGKTLVAGYFDNFQGVTQKELIRLNTDGSKDTSFKLDGVFKGGISSILLQADGKILVMGAFTNYVDIGRNYLVRLNPDGSLDTSFTKIFEFEYFVEAMALQPDGKILVHTYEWQYNPISFIDRNKLIRLNTDGSKDTSFNTKHFNIPSSSIVVQNDGKILVGGVFTKYNNITQKYLIRLNPDGSKDTSFDTGTVFDFSNKVRNITLQPDGKILVNGAFSPTTGDYQSFLIRLNSDGSKDVSFNEGTGLDNVRTGYGIGIRSVVLQNDGKILVGGEFDTYQGIAQNRLTRLNIDGSIDTSFDIGTGFVAPVETLSLYPDGKIIVGGTFSSYRGVSNLSYLIRLKGTSVQPKINATTIQTNLTCAGISTGSASILSVYNGKSPYSYLWSNGATTAKITGLGAGNYSCTITDADSSTVTKSFIIITDSDFQKPTISIPPTLTINTNGNCTATGVVLGTPVTTDNCTISSVTNNAPSVFPIGNTTVTWTVKDASNNDATATQIIIVKDVTKPTIFPPAKITVNTTSNCTATGIVLGTPTTADNCTVASVTNNAPITYPLGNTTVTWVVKDESNNIATAIQIITVIDVTKPTITAPADKTVNTTASNCSATGVLLGTPTTADNCSVTSVANNAPTSFPIGNTTVTWTVKDASNNTATATQIVTVIDVTKPTIIAPPTVIVNADSNGIATGVVLGTPTTSDNCSVASVTNNAPTTFPLGNTTVTWTVKDASNNTATATQIVTVKDAAPTTLIPVANFTAATTTVNTNGSINFKDNSTNTPTSWAWEITRSGSTTLTSSLQTPTFTFVDAGTYTVKLIATNGAGSNTKTVTNMITVTPPALIPVANFTASTTAANTNESINFKDNSTNTPTSWAWEITRTGSTTLTSSLQNPTFAFVDAGTYTVKLTATNAAGSNTKTVTNMITVIISLPSNNFTIESKGETCLNENNGEINIVAKASYNYVATINGTKYPLVNNSLKVSNLVPAVYNVSITITGELFEQNFTITIPKGATITAKSTVSSRLASVEITEGTAPYTVFINGEEQFETASDTFSVGVNKGDFLEVKTAKACEGIYLKEIDTDVLESVLAHPNPTNGKFDIEVPISIKKVLIDLYTMDSKIISKETYTPINGRVSFNLENQASGVYIAKIYLDQPKYLKIIKK